MKKWPYQKKKKLQMKTNRIISITGNIAGGKTKLTQIVSKKLGMQVYSGSERFRTLAENSNMNITEFNEYVANKPEIDKEIDRLILKDVEGKDNIIIDSRLAWLFINESFKVYITVNIDEAAKRLIADSVNRKAEQRYTSIEEAKSAIFLREEYERNRYLKEYNVDIGNKDNYDFVVDTSSESLNVIADKIVSEYKKWLNN